MREFLRTLAAWLEAYQAVAIWLEGIALAAILALDWRERIDQGKERREEHKKTAEPVAPSPQKNLAAAKSAETANTSSKTTPDNVRGIRQPIKEQLDLGDR